MSKGVNLVVLMGHVGSEPEIRTTAGGTRVAKVSLATNDGWGDKEKTNWHRLTVFGKLVDVVEKYVRKGDRLHVTGRIDYSQTEANGTTKYWTDIIVDNLVLAGGNTDERPDTVTPYTGKDPFSEDRSLPF